MNAIFRAERDASAKGETRGREKYFSRLALLAKYRVRPAWLIKRLSSRLKKTIQNSFNCHLNNAQLLRDSEPIRLFETPRSLSEYLSKMNKDCF